MEAEFKSAQRFILCYILYFALVHVVFKTCIILFVWYCLQIFEKVLSNFNFLHFGGNCIPDQNLACFVLYLKIIKIFL